MTKSNTRYINNCGRVNIPFKIREQLGISSSTPLTVSVQDQKIILEKVQGK